MDCKFLKKKRNKQKISKPTNLFKKASHCISRSYTSAIKNSSFFTFFSNTLTLKGLPKQRKYASN